MPGRDGTGPMGTGPAGGRRFGNCAAQGAIGQGFGRGFGQGANGRGRGGMLQGGGRFGFNAPEQNSTATMESQELMRQNEVLRSELEATKKRLDELEVKIGEKRNVL